MSKEKWNRLLATGAFDQIEHPPEGYQLDEVVSGRDGITYVVQGTTGDGDLILGTDRDPNKGKQQVRRENFVRPFSTITTRSIEGGFAKVREDDLIRTKKPRRYQGKSSKNN